jgi:hypothetical protein
MTTKLCAAALVLLAAFGLGCGDDDNVHAAPVCSVQACGGDVVGEWEIESACIVEEDCSGESGTVTGAYTFTADSYDFDWLIETSGCGFRGESDSSGGGSYRAEGNFLYRGTTDEPIFEYCVDADGILHLLDVDEFSDGESFTLHRL